MVAVVDAAEAYGGPVDPLGHSYGGNIAYGTATRTPNVRRLVLQEGWPVPNLAHRSTPPELLAALELQDSSPTWPVRVAAAGTVPRELRAFAAHAFDPATAARITASVLLLVGSESPSEIRADPEVVAAALPDVRIHVLPGQAHLAQLTGPQAFVDALLAFLEDRHR